jgi:hypothetical protein
VRELVRQVVQALGIELQRKVKAEKLSGQVLNVRTGRLRRSINEETHDAGDVVESTVGTPVVYGRFWELGFDGVEQVKAHTATAFGVEQQVRAHTRTVHGGAAVPAAGAGGDEGPHHRAALRRGEGGAPVMRPLRAGWTASHLRGAGARAVRPRRA